MPMLHEGCNLCIDSFDGWRAAAYTDLLSQQFVLKWVKKHWLSVVNKEETIEAEQAHFCWNTSRTVHINSSKWTERNAVSGGRHGDELLRQCWGTASGRRGHPRPVRETGLFGAISVSSLPTAILFVASLLLLRWLFITMVLVDPGCDSAAC